jgi:hypothetical protein
MEYAPFGASWGSDDRIVFDDIRGDRGLSQVSAAGGSPQVLTTVNTADSEHGHRLPHVLPGGDAVLFTVTRTRYPKWHETQIAAYSRSTRAQSIVLDGGADARYAQSGHLIYVREGVLMAVPFNLRQVKVTGSAVGLVPNIMQAAYDRFATSESGAAQFDISRAGTLLYVQGGIVPDAVCELVWVDRTGRAEALSLTSGPFMQPRLSPDGRRLAVATFGRNMDIWVFEIERGTFTRLTTEGRNGTPVWTPDGTRLVYRSGLVGPENLFWRLADGGGVAERLTTSKHNEIPASWSPDGKALLYYELGINIPIIRLPLDADRRPHPLVEGSFNAGHAEVSPDGQWLAYSSNQSGRNEVYAQGYGREGPRQQISIGGGHSPIWRRDGTELVYLRPASFGSAAVSVMAVPITRGPRLTLGTPKRLFEGAYQRGAIIRNYDVTSDGQRFLMVREKERILPKLAEMVLVQNWFEELKRLVPGK